VCEPLPRFGYETCKNKIFTRSPTLSRYAQKIKNFLAVAAQARSHYNEYSICLERILIKDLFINLGRVHLNRIKLMQHYRILVALLQAAK
jgi:hypothetical protein